MCLRRHFAWLVGLILFSARLACAGRPMTTDDASITPLGQCQAQNWLQADRHAWEGWSLPACTFLPDIELTAGGALHRGDGGDYRLASAQIKFLLRDESPGAWGFAASLGWSHIDALDPAARVDARPLDLIASYRATDASYLLHVDVGMRRDAIADTDRATWGVAYERAPDARLGGFVEAFGAQGEAPTLQAGLRYDLVPQRLSVNFTVGAQCRAGLRDPFITLGFNL